MKTSEMIYNHSFSAAVVLLTFASVHAQDDWQTVDTLSVAAHNIYPVGVAVDRSNRVFVVGWEFDSTNFTSIVRRSDDGGAMWQTQSSVSLPQFPSGWGMTVNDKRRLAFHPNGDIYAAGLLHQTEGWTVQKSSDGGSTWTTVDSYALDPAGAYSAAVDLTCDTAGQIFVVGYGGGSSGPGWLVRKSIDAGQTWTNVDLFGADGESPLAVLATGGQIYVAGNRYVRHSGDGGATWQTVDDWSATGTATGLAADRLGNVYAAGVVNVAQPDGSGRWHWQVRRSNSGGTNWTAVDDLTPTLTSLVDAVVTDSLGRVFVVGRVDYHWIVRRSDDAGASWTTSDQFAVDLAFPSNRATSAAADSAGNIYVVGRGVQPDAPSNRGVWVVRKLAAPSPGPTLSATLAGSQLKLAWPTNATGFVLQSATTLASGGDWQDFLTLPTEINGQKVVTITPTGPCGFFRLRGP